MDEVITKTKKSKEVEINAKELFTESQRNSEEINVSIFDITLNEIDQILNTLEQKSENKQERLDKLDVLPEIKSSISKIHIAKNKLEKEENNIIQNNNLVKSIEVLEKNINNSNKTVSLSDQSKHQILDEIKEHKIDKNLLTIDEIRNFKENDEIKKKNFFGFYIYLIIVIIIFGALYGTLSMSKGLIILKYPITGPYIQIFFEIVEIIKLTIFSILNFINNKI